MEKILNDYIPNEEEFDKEAGKSANKRSGKKSENVKPLNSNESLLIAVMSEGGVPVVDVPDDVLCDLLNDLL
jgi:hypothetical protein